MGGGFGGGSAFSSVQDDLGPALNRVEILAGESGGRREKGEGEIRQSVGQASSTHPQCPLTGTTRYSPMLSSPGFGPLATLPR